MLHKRHVWAAACILLSIIPLSAAAGAADISPVIAVVDFKNTGQGSSLDYLEKTIPEAIITSLAKSGQIEIVERARLQDAVNELQLGISGIIDEATAIEVGRAVGANAIMLGSYVAIGERIRINARLIDVKTSKIIKAESVQGKVGEEIFDILDRMALAMEKQLIGETTPPAPTTASPTAVVTRQPNHPSPSSAPAVAPAKPTPDALTYASPATKPIWQRKGFWIASGVAVAAGIVTVVLLTQPGPDAKVNITVNIPF